MLSLSLSIYTIHIYKIVLLLKQFSNLENESKYKFTKCLRYNAYKVLNITVFFIGASMTICISALVR